MTQEHLQVSGYGADQYPVITPLSVKQYTSSSALAAVQSGGLLEATENLISAIRLGTVSRQVMRDEQVALRWIEETLHPKGLCCPRCESKYRRVARHKGKIPAWRCTDCDRYYTMMSGTIFEKTRQSAHGLLQIIHGIFQGRALAHLAQEMQMSRKQVYNIREKLAKFDNEFAVLSKEGSQKLPA